MSTAPPESSHPEADHGECPQHSDLLKYQSMPERLSGFVREKIATHIPGCVRCTEFCGRIETSIAEGERLISSLPEDDRLVELATTTPNDDCHMLSAIIEKCADLLRMDLSCQYAVEALTSLTHREKLPPHLLARIEDICEAEHVTIE